MNPSEKPGNRNWPTFEILLLLAVLLSVFLGSKDAPIFNFGLLSIGLMAIYFLVVRPVFILFKDQQWLVVSSLMLGVSLAVAGLCYHFNWSGAFSVLLVAQFIFLVVFALRNTIPENTVYSQSLIRHFLVIFILIALKMH